MALSLVALSLVVLASCHPRVCARLSPIQEWLPIRMNGHAYPDTAPILAPAGTSVRLRLINASYLSHILHLHGLRYQLVATDGASVAQPSLIDALLPIAPGQRMDITFVMPRGLWSLHDHNGLPGAPEMRVLLGQGNHLSPEDAQADRQPQALPVLDLARYGRPAPAPFSRASRFDRVFQLVINQRTMASARPGMSTMSSGSPNDQMTTIYTMNGAAFPRTTPLQVRAGQRIELIFVNRGKDAHPMHLHGHRLQVLVLNGEPVTGAPLYQDTVMVSPGATTIVAFVANNPGIWVLHCHELHHATAGLVALLRYQGITQTFAPSGPFGNVPE